MLTIPVTLTRLMVRFAPLFSKRVWAHAQVLRGGALLAPGKRTVTAGLWGMGLSQERQCQQYHRVLNRARWPSPALARVLLEMGVHTFAPTGAGVRGIDDTLERRRGEKVKAEVHWLRFRGLPGHTTWEMKITGVIWRREVVDKLAWKHPVTTDEVEEALAAARRFRFIETGDVEGEDLYAALSRTAAGRYFIPILSTRPQRKP